MNISGIFFTICIKKFFPKVLILAFLRYLINNHVTTHFYYTIFLFSGHCANMEMTENCHVYSNPSYPGHHFPPMTSEAATMQIGGLPFYLPQQQPQESSVDSPSKQTISLDCLKKLETKPQQKFWLPFF